VKSKTFDWNCNFYTSIQKLQFLNKTKQTKNGFRKIGINLKTACAGLEQN
jgi:hypothetical protein